MRNLFILGVVLAAMILTTVSGTGCRMPAKRTTHELPFHVQLDYVYKIDEFQAVKATVVSL